MRQYRHGDLLIVEVASIPAPATASDDHVLAYGEVTGHAHRLDAGAWLFQLGETLYFRVPSEARLTHEEHHTITLPAGDYQVVRQREYSPGAIHQMRWVVD
jgi:hypothetical protein